MIQETSPMTNFNSRAHVERDDDVATFVGGIEEFQLTRSRGARLAMYKRTAAIYYFNSRAHVERDKRAEYIAKRRAISTHALTWSAT